MDLIRRRAVERILVIPDLHLDATEEIHPAYKLVKKFAKAFEPDGVMFLGDVLDFAYISSFEEKNLRLISVKSFKPDFDLWKRELDYWQTLTGTIWLREGNHEERITRYIDKNPQLKGALELEEQCEYAKRGLLYAKVLDPPTKIGHCNFIHGWYTNLYHAKKHVTMMGESIAYAHVHDVQSYSLKTLANDHEVCAWSLGCLCDVQPDWLKGRPSRWMHAFATFYVNKRTGRFNLYPVRIFDNEFIWDGHLWK